MTVASAATVTTAADQMSPGRHGISAVWLRDMAVIIGGESCGGCPLRDLTMYQPGKAPWDFADWKLPRGRHVTSAATDGRDVYVFGGFAYCCANLDEIVKANPTTRTVEVLGTRLPTPLAHTSTVYAGSLASPRMYVFGGTSGGWSGASAAVLEFDPASGTLRKAGDLPTPRFGTSAVWDPSVTAACPQGCAYVFGGVDNLGRELDDIVRFDPATGRSEELPASLPSPRHWTSAVFDGARAYVFGGHDGRGPLADIVAFEPYTVRASLLPQRLPLPASETAAVWTGEVAVVFGGNSASGLGPPDTSIVVFVPEPTLAGVHDTILRAIHSLESRILGAIEANTALVLGSIAAEGDAIRKDIRADGNRTRTTVNEDGGRTRGHVTREFADRAASDPLEVSLVRSAAAEATGQGPFQVLVTLRGVAVDASLEASLDGVPLSPSAAARRGVGTYHLATPIAFQPGLLLVQARFESHAGVAQAWMGPPERAAGPMAESRWVEVAVLNESVALGSKEQTVGPASVPIGRARGAPQADGSYRLEVSIAGVVTSVVLPRAGGAPAMDLALVDVEGMRARTPGASVQAIVAYRYDAAATSCLVERDGVCVLLPFDPATRWAAERGGNATLIVTLRLASDGKVLMEQQREVPLLGQLAALTPSG